MFKLNRLIGKEKAALPQWKQQMDELEAICIRSVNETDPSASLQMAEQIATGFADLELPAEEAYHLQQWLIEKMIQMPVRIYNHINAKNQDAAKELMALLTNIAEGRGKFAAWPEWTTVVQAQAAKELDKIKAEQHIS